VAEACAGAGTGAAAELTVSADKFTCERKHQQQFSAGEGPSYRSSAPSSPGACAATSAAQFLLRQARVPEYDALLAARKGSGLRRMRRKLTRNGAPIRPAIGPMGCALRSLVWFASSLLSGQAAGSTRNASAWSCAAFLFWAGKPRGSRRAALPGRGGRKSVEEAKGVFE